MEEEARVWIQVMAESVFSSFKRMFGEYVSFVKLNNIVNELMLKACVYNMFIGKRTTARNEMKDMI